jgi:uncharacterized protein YndB with AHSA1/START domain
VKLALAYDEFLPHPIDAVWEKLTDAASIGEWLMTTPDFEPKPGARFRLKTQSLSGDGWIKAEVLELEPPQRMVWAWAGDDGSSTTVTFELSAVEGGTRLRLTHVGEIDAVVGDQLERGWPGRIDALGSALG